jgi:hypothetical protein
MSDLPHGYHDPAEMVPEVGDYATAVAPDQADAEAEQFDRLADNLCAQADDTAALTDHQLAELADL